MTRSAVGPALRMVRTATAAAAVLLAVVATPASALDGWTDAHEVAGQNSFPGVTPNFPDFGGPAVAADPLGPVTVATSACSPFQGYYGASCEPDGGGLLADTLAGGTWQSQEQLMPGGIGPYSIATGAGGDAVVVYVGCASGCTPGSLSPTLAVMARERPSGSDTWGDPVTISSDLEGGADGYSLAKVTVDKDGNAWIAWYAPSVQLEARELQSDGSLGSIQVVSEQSDQGSPEDDFDLAGDPAGHAALVWTSAGTTGTDGIRVSVLSNGTWGAATTLDAPTSDSSTGPDRDPIATFGPGGRPIVGWDATGSSGYGLHTSTYANGSWSSAQLVPSSDDARVVNNGPRFARDAAGDVQLAWVGQDLTDPPTDRIVTRVASMRAGSSSWTTKTIAAASPPAGATQQSAYGGAVDIASNDEGDTVLSWTSQVGDDPAQVYAAIAPAGKPFGAPATLNDFKIEYPWYNAAPARLTAVIDAHGIATVTWLASDDQADSLLVSRSTTGALDGSGAGPGGDGGGGDTTPPTVTPSKGRNAAPATSARMPNVIGKDEEDAVRAVTAAGIYLNPDVAVVERHLKKPPKGVGIGDVYAQRPKAGTTIRSSQLAPAKLRINVYSGPSGFSPKQFKQERRQFLGGPLSKLLDNGDGWDVALAGWKVNFNFVPTDVKEPTIGAIDLQSPETQRVLVTVDMPADQLHYIGRMEHDAGLVSDIPTFGIADGALSTGIKNVFGEQAQVGEAPAAGSVIVDMHDVGGDGDGDVGRTEVKTVTARAVARGSDPAICRNATCQRTVAASVATFDVKPEHPGTIYAVTRLDGRDGPSAFEMDAFPVVDRTTNFATFAGQEFDSSGHYEGRAIFAARDRIARSAGIRAAGGCGWWQWVCDLFGIHDQVAAPTAKCAPAASTVDTGPQDVAVIDGNLGHVAPGMPADPKGTPLYDFGTDVYPIVDACSSGLPPGQDYVMHDGKAVNPVTHQAYIIAAGAGNIISEAGAGVIGAGGGNFAEGQKFGVVADQSKVSGFSAGTWQNALPMIDGRVYGLAPGTYRVVDGKATPIIAAGAGNIIAAGAGNIIAAGAGNVSNGDYDVIGDSGYALALAALPKLLPADTAAKVAEKGGSTSFDADSLLGGYGSSTDGTAMTLTLGSDPSKHVTVDGRIIAAGAGNIIAAGAGNIISEAGAGIIAAGAGNIISEAGGG